VEDATGSFGTERAGHGSQIGERRRAAQG
jgi:hypothetical protein